MKRIVCIVITLVMLINASGCSLVNSRLNQLNEEISSEEDAMERVETTVIQALENKDEELLKSIFSEKALTKAGDMDKGIAYMIEQYKGGDIEIIEDNHSAWTFNEKGVKKQYISAWCSIKMNQENYILSWVDWTMQEEHPEAVGVYCLQIRKQTEERTVPFRAIAGINYPDRALANKIISDFGDAFDSFSGQDIELFKSLLSSELLEKKETEQSIDAFKQLLSNFSYSDINDGWVAYNEIDGVEKMHTYFEVIIDDKPYIAYVALDDVERDKLSVFQIVEDNGGDFEEETECGIYLP